jgi:hypothetical protein
MVHYLVGEAGYIFVNNHLFLVHRYDQEIRYHE